MFSLLESNRLSNSFVNDREKFYKIVQQIYSLFNDIIIKKQQQQEKNNNSNKKYARSISRDFPKNFFSSGFSFNLILCNVKNIWNLYMFFAAEIYKIVRCYFCSMFVFFRTISCVFSMALRINFQYMSNEIHESTHEKRVNRF